MQLTIIILSYNDYPGTTGLCLASLAQDPTFPEWEVIVVDNASNAETIAQLKQAEQRYPAVRFIFNERNLGYAGGNNVGMKLASGDCVVLLNSDTIIPSGMMGRLAQHFEEDGRIGMLGPVTNAAGNEQCIYTDATTVEGIIADGLRYANSGTGDCLDAYRMDFHCVAISRKVIEKAGLLDEDFGRGYYEDFDYSLRVKEAGFLLKFAEDVFVYHRGSASFSSLPREVKALHKRNKRRLLDKHGKGVRFLHIREGNLAVLSQYLEMQNNGRRIPECRINNRMMQANKLRPRSWLKRWLYLRRMSRLVDSLAKGY